MAPEASDVMDRSDDDDSPSLQADSGIGIDDSSVLNGYIFLFGRQYRDWGPAKENCEQYFCPNDEQELERLDVQHHAFLVLMDSKLHFAPVSTTSPIEVLDVCTGTGVWAIDVADECPQWNVRGIDWTPGQPCWVPSNTKFEIDDLRLPWCYNNIFDYIHTRATIYMGCWKDFKLDVVQQAFDGLQPGGWFECQEIGGLVECDDGTLPSDAPLTSWARALNIAGSKMGRPRDVAGRISEWYKEVGFVDVQQHALKMPIGNWPKDTRMKEAGLFWKLSMERALEGLSLRLFNEAFGWELADITALLHRVRQDIKNSSIHAYTEVFVVFGRKPMPGEPALVNLSPPEAVEESNHVPTHSNEMASWSSTPESVSSNSADLFGSDVWNDANSSNISQLASVTLADDDSAHSSLFRHQRQDLVNHLMGQLCRYLDSRVAEAQSQRAHSLDADESQRRGVQSQPETGQRPALQANSTSGEVTASAQGAIVVPLRRATPPSPESDEEDDEDGDSRRRKRPHLTSSHEAKKLACPYYKRNPRKYSKWTSCPGPGWDEVHRVKAHLYKRHALPLQCPRCWEPFRSEARYREHLQQDPPCAVLANQKIVDGFTKEQEKMLRSRRRARPDMSRVDKWKEVYTILFPDDDVDNLPSPYYETTDSDARGGIEDYSVFLRREMPALVRRELDLMFQDELRDMEVTLRPRIEQMMIELQPRLLRMFQESEAAPDGEPENPDEPQQVQQYLAPFQVTPQDAHLNAGVDPMLDYPDEGELGWDRDPSVSGSAVTLFSEALLDINFEKLLDPTFAYVDMAFTTLDGSHSI